MANITDNNPAKIRRNLAIAEQRAAGVDPAVIAQSHGVSKATVYNVLQQDRSKEILEQVYKRYVAAAKGIGKRFVKLCHSDDEAIASKNIAKFHDIMGFSPSHSQSVFIQQIFNTTINQVPDDVVNVISRYMDAEMAIPAEYKDANSDT